MKIKIMKDKKSQIIEIHSRLIEDLQYTCRKWRLRWYTIIKFIYD